MMLGNASLPQLNSTQSFGSAFDITKREMKIMSNFDVDKATIKWEGSRNFKLYLGKHASISITVAGLIRCNSNLNSKKIEVMTF